MSWAQAKASHDNPNWSADRPQSWACLFLFLYSFPKLPITSFMPIRILPFQLKTYLLCKSFPNALDRNRSFLFLNFHRPVSLSNTDCTFCYAFFASPQGDFKLSEDRDHMLQSSVFFMVPGMSYPHQMVN